MTNRKIDMSPESIDRRLRDVAQLCRLGKALAAARRIGKKRPQRAPKDDAPQHDQKLES